MTDAATERADMGEIAGRGASQVIGTPSGALLSKDYVRSPAAEVRRDDDAPADLSGFTLPQICAAMQDDPSIGAAPFFNSYLVPIRVSGTGAAARPSIGEVAVRDADLWRSMVPDALGCPVIVEHPESGSLDSQSFAQQAVGSLVHVWFDESTQELWGVARIIDRTCAALIEDGTLFDTSPSVLFPQGAEGQYLDVDGVRVLAEGQPALLDHVALLSASPGVWTRDGKDGIRNEGEQNG